MAHGVFGADSGFGVGLRAAGGVGVAGFRLVFAGLSFWRGGWGLGYHSMRFRHLIFPKGVTLMLFGNSWNNSYIPCL